MTNTPTREGQEMHKTPCENCSCKKDKVNYRKSWLMELYDHYIERKQTGEIFQCYMRRDGKGCCLHYAQVKRMDKNIRRIKTILFGSISNE